MFAQTALVGAGRNGTFHRRLHLRHARLRRRAVRAALHAGARARPALRAVGRAGVRRAAGDRRPAREAAPQRRSPTTRCGARRSRPAPTGSRSPRSTSGRRARRSSPPRRRRRHGAYRYGSLRRRVGARAASTAETAYLGRTAYWARLFRQPARLAPPALTRAPGRRGRSPYPSSRGRPHRLRAARAAAERADDRAARRDPGLRGADPRVGRRAELAGGDPLRAPPAITDQIDGFLARRWHVESAFGRIADPLADRLLIDVDRDPALARRPAAVGRAR